MSVISMFVGWTDGGSLRSVRQYQAASGRFPVFHKYFYYLFVLSKTFNIATVTENEENLSQDLWERVLVKGPEVKQLLDF
jgi:hypothetical protein